MSKLFVRLDTPHTELRLKATFHYIDRWEGASAYARNIDYARFREIADEVGAYLLVDMAHVAGLVAAGVYPSPVPYADVTTSTTHKTLRGPRGGIILAKENAEIEKKLNSAMFPGTQGGPLMHVIAAKAVCFKEAASDEFKAYQRQVVANARAMAEGFQKRGYKVVSGGTDNHLFLVDLIDKDITGKDAEEALGRAWAAHPAHLRSAVIRAAPRPHRTVRVCNCECVYRLPHFPCSASRLRGLLMTLARYRVGARRDQRSRAAVPHQTGSKLGRKLRPPKGPAN